MGEQKKAPGRVSRRELIRGGSEVIGAATAISGGALFAQRATGPGAQRATPSSLAGRIIKAFVRRPQGASVQQVKLWTLRDDMVAVRTEAAQCCYTIVNAALGSGDVGAGGAGGAVPARILGHGGVGIVEATGAAVERIRPGDRVLVTNTPNCGACYNCIRGRGDMCQMNPAEGEPLLPIGELADGTPVHQHNNTGGFADFMITFDWYCVPVFTKTSAIDLSVLGCAGATGLGAATTFVPVDFGSNVVIMGAGPVGLSAIQGARIRGAAKIIAVEPIAARREVALRVGATVALDPNVEGNGLVEKIRELCRDSAARKLLGGRNHMPGSDAAGADFVIATVGADAVAPKVEQGPDPTALVPTRQAWEMTRAGGHLVTVGLPRGEISLPASAWSNRGRIHHAGQYGGVNAKTDVPKFIQMIEIWQFNAKALATSVYPLERAKEAFQAVGDRTTVGAVLTFL
jgi:S-(hydroxymethyl)glutathione dehydrogenase/alcohol dehydrogenase